MIVEIRDFHITKKTKNKTKPKKNKTDYLITEGNKTKKYSLWVSTKIHLVPSLIIFLVLVFLNDAQNPFGNSTPGNACFSLSLYSGQFL